MAKTGGLVPGEARNQVTAHFESDDDGAEVDGEVDEGLALMSSFDSHNEFAIEFTKQNGLEDHSRAFRNAAVLLRSDMTPEEVPDLTSAELQALQAETEHKWRQAWSLYLTILMCSIGAIEQGMAQTSMNGANLYFPKEFGIDTDSPHNTLIVGLINSGIYLSVGFFGAWLSEPINDRLGRRGAICVASLICFMGNLASAFSWNWQSLLFFRVLLGAGLGLNVGTINVYAAESAPSYIRGGLAVSWQMFTAFGLLVGFIANIAVFNVASPWRWQLAFPFIPAVPLALCIWMCPESPSWLIKSSQDYCTAFRSLRTLRNTEIQAAKEVYTMYLQQSHSRPKQARSSALRRLVELVTIPRNRRATLAAFVVMLSQQLCGSINIIAFFSSTIFLDSGFSQFQALLASTVFGFVNFIGAIPAIWSMEALGRRSLLLYTLPPMALVMFLASLVLQLPEDNSARLGGLAAAIYVFCALYSPGMGPVPAPYCAEVFPLSHRELGMSFAVSVANTWAAVLSLTFPLLLAALGPAGAFGLYAGLNMVAYLLVFLFVPETRLKSLDELDEVFSVRTRDFMRRNVVSFGSIWERRCIKPHKTWSTVRSSGATRYRALHQIDEDQ